MGEHLPYKQRVIGSSPILSTKKDIGRKFGFRYGGLEVGAVVNDSPVGCQSRE